MFLTLAATYLMLENLYLFVIFKSAKIWIVRPNFIITWTFSTEKKLQLKDQLFSAVFI